MEDFGAYLASAFGYDFDVLWAGGRAVLDRLSPYGVHGFVYPLSLAWFMVPFALLPREIAHLVMIAISLGLLRLIKPPLKAYFFAPVLYCMFIGQIEVLLLILGLAGSWAGLAVSMIKPQIGIWIVIYQFWRWRTNDRRKILFTIFGIGGIYLLPLLADPAWISAWLSSTPDVLDYVSQSSSLFGVGRLIPLNWSASAAIVAAFGVVILSVEAWRGRIGSRYWEYVALFNPLSHVYTMSILYTQIDRVAVLLSWLALPFRFIFGSGFPMTVIPIYLLIKRGWRSYPMEHDE